MVFTPDLENKKVLRKAGDKIITQNIWLDVFVIDGMPASKVGRWLHYYRIRFCQNLFRTARSARNGVLKEKKRSFVEKAVIFFLRLVPIGKLLSIKKMVSITNDTLAKYPFHSSDAVIAYVPLYGKRCIVPRNIFDGKRTGIFEGYSFPIPLYAERLLTSWYGDYMSLPPLEERRASHCEDVVESI